jgi:hypothetical protein
MRSLAESNSDTRRNKKAVKQWICARLVEDRGQLSGARGSNPAVQILNFLIPMCTVGLETREYGHWDPLC